MTPEDDVWADLDTTGTHAYLFMHLVEGRSVRQAVDALRASMPDAGSESEHTQQAAEWTERGWRALSAAEFVGPYAAFAHLRVDGDLVDLQDFMAALARDLGIRSNYALTGPSYTDSSGQILIAKFKKCEVVCLVGVWAGKGRVQEVLQALGDHMGETFKGATVTFGRTDILLELGASSLEPITQAVLETLQNIEGVRKTESAFADFRRYDGS
jgi:hypothetical protein